MTVSFLYKSFYYIYKRLLDTIKKKKERLKKKARENYQDLSDEEKSKRNNIVANDTQEEKTKRDNMVANNIKIYLKNKGWLSIENIIKYGKIKPL